MRKEIDLNIEALRGFCAVMVLIHHGIEFSSKLDNGFDFRSQFFLYKPSGHLMVLVFFMLSGYVIGVSSLNQSQFNTWEYIKKRVTRLYPTYIIAILFTILFFAEKWQSVIGTLFFVQNLFTTVIEHNNPLWSLNHEVVYYLLVIPVFVFRIKPVTVIVILLLLLGLSVKKMQFPKIMEGYLVGFIFWMTGFAISKFKAISTINIKVNPDKLLSVFFLLLSCEYLNAFNLSRIYPYLNLVYGPSYHFLDWLVNIDDLSALPFCLYAILVASAVDWKWITRFVYFACWSHLIYLLINGSFFKTNMFYVPALFLVISTVFVLSPVKIVKSLSFWVYAGSISYAMYVIHMPLLQLLGRVTLFSGGIGWFALRFIILSIIVTGVSVLVEKVLQPRVKLFFGARQANRISIHSKI